MDEATTADGHWYIMSARSSFRFGWDVIIILFAIQNAITLPMEIAFEAELEGIEALRYLDYVTTCVFFVDIVAGFMTSFIKISTGDEIFSMRMIALNYILAGTFFIDIFSTFPLDAMSEPLVDMTPSGSGGSIVKTLKILGFLKM